jgi:hypothetical protein
MENSHDISLAYDESGVESMDFDLITDSIRSLTTEIQKYVSLIADEIQEGESNELISTL